MQQEYSKIRFIVKLVVVLNKAKYFLDNPTVLLAVNMVMHDMI